MWENTIEDLHYAEKQALINLHMTPEVYERQNYYRFNKILLAQGEEDREVDVDDLFGADSGTKGRVFFN